MTSNTVWPVTPLGAVRLAWAIPADLDRFLSARLVLIPSASSPPLPLPAVTCYLCPAQAQTPSVTANCKGPFTQMFTSVANQLSEVDLSEAVGANLGTPGATYVSLLAFTTPSTATDR